MAQSDAAYPVNHPLYLKHSSGLTEGGSGPFAGSALSTGDLRRKWNFAERFSELALDQTPFFRLVSKVAKKPTDDPSFKFTEKRQSWMKRYAYVVGQVITGDADSFANAAFRNYNDSATAAANEAIATGDTVKLYMATDYESAGNIQNIFGQSTGAIAVGAAGTAPEFLLPNQILQVNLSSTAQGGATSGVVSGYALIQITAVTAAEVDKADSVDESIMICKLVTGTVIKAASGELCSYVGDKPKTQVYDKDVSGGKLGVSLESMRSYVVGNAYEEGSSLMGKTWKDNPYSTGYGQTQIFRSEFGMTNTARATVLKYEPNEWARVWRDKLIEHKWEIEQTGLFGSQYTDSSAEINYTQGAVDYISNYGNVFSWSTSKTVDSFMDDMSSYIDPRYNSSKATVYFCNTQVYNWLHKLGGYFKNNLSIGQVDGTDNNSQLFSADLAITGRKKVLGLDMTKISTPLGDMSVVRNIALDRSSVKILGINMGNVKYRPLVGNGVNRDTSIYVGVQSLENTGTDKRVDMILTEAGFEWQMPESHAVWS